MVTTSPTASPFSLVTTFNPLSPSGYPSIFGFVTTKVLFHRLSFVSGFPMNSLMVLTTKYLLMYCTELCLASSKILTPPPPSPPSECVLPPHQRRGGGGGGGVNILEDARHWSGLLQYNLSTVLTISYFLSFLVSISYM
jgi:hypothetical protein